MKLSDQDKISVVERYKSGESAISIAKSFGVSHTPIYSILRVRKIAIRSAIDCHKKYRLNDAYFDEIDTEEKAYFLGLLFADGYVSEKYNYVRLSLQEEDGYLVQSLRDAMACDRPLETRDYSKKGWKNQTCLTISNRNVVDSLVKLGCRQKKSFTAIFPPIDVNLTNHFARGYFDGDGSIRWSKPKRFQVPKAVIDIIGTEMTLSPIRERFVYESGIDCVLKQHGSGLFTISIGGNNKVKEFGNWMYKNAVTYMLRKKHKFDELSSLATDEIRYSNLCKSHECNC